VSAQRGPAAVENPLVLDSDYVIDAAFMAGPADDAGLKIIRDLREKDPGLHEAGAECGVCHLIEHGGGPLAASLRCITLGRMIEHSRGAVIPGWLEKACPTHKRILQYHLTYRVPSHPAFAPKP
jgi:hypothetical protein